MNPPKVDSIRWNRVSFNFCSKRKKYKQSLFQLSNFQSIITQLLSLSCCILDISWETKNNCLNFLSNICSLVPKHIKHCMQHFFLGLISMFGHSQRRKAYTWTMGLILTRLQAGLFSYIYFHPFTGWVSPSWIVSFFFFFFENNHELFLDCLFCLYLGSAFCVFSSRSIFFFL